MQDMQPNDTNQHQPIVIEARKLAGFCANDMKRCLGLSKKFFWTMASSFGVVGAYAAESTAAAITGSSLVVPMQILQHATLPAAGALWAVGFVGLIASGSKFQKLSAQVKNFWDEGGQKMLLTACQKNDLQGVSIALQAAKELGKASPVLETEQLFEAVKTAAYNRQPEIVEAIFNNIALRDLKNLLAHPDMPHAIIQQTYLDRFADQAPEDQRSLIAVLRALYINDDYRTTARYLNFGEGRLDNVEMMHKHKDVSRMITVLKSQVIKQVVRDNDPHLRSLTP